MVKLSAKEKNVIIDKICDSVGEFRTKQFKDGKKLLIAKSRKQKRTEKLVNF